MMLRHQNCPKGLGTGYLGTYLSKCVEDLTSGHHLKEKQKCFESHQAMQECGSIHENNVLWNR